MKINRKHALAIAAGAVLAAGTGMVQAAVSAEEAAKLGRELTPVGAEKAGNAAGTIPAWDGGITRPPAGFRVGTFHIDPFAKRMLLAGTDELGYLLTKESELAAWEAGHPPRVDTLAGAR